MKLFFQNRALCLNNEYTGAFSRDKRRRNKDFKIVLLKCSPDYDSELEREYDSFRPIQKHLSPSRYSRERIVLESTHKTQSLSQVSELNHTPEDSAKKDHYRFNCPICFKHFSNIFVSKCCNNYFCNLCYKQLREDMRKKGYSNALRCNFCGRFPLKLEKVDHEDPVRLYKEPPLKALQSKLSLSDIEERDENRFPSSFISHENYDNGERPRLDEDRVCMAPDEVPLMLTETDVCIPSEDEEEDKNMKSINSINISACGKLKFHRGSQSNISTNLDSQMSRDKVPHSSSKRNILKDVIDSQYALRSSQNFYNERQNQSERKPTFKKSLLGSPGKTKLQTGPVKTHKYRKTLCKRMMGITENVKGVKFYIPKNGKQKKKLVKRETKNSNNKHSKKEEPTTAQKLRKSRLIRYI